MSERLIDIRTELAASAHTRVEVGQDGVLHVLAGPVTLHMDRGVCEELTNTLARAMVTLARAQTERRRAPSLRLLRDPPRERGDDETPGSSSTETPTPAR